MLPIQPHKLLQMERAWWNLFLKWRCGCEQLSSQCEIFRTVIFPLKCLFFFFFFGVGCHGNKHGACSFCLGVFFFLINFVVVVVVYEIQRVVWGKHVAPVFLFVWCTGVLQKAWHGCCRPAFLCGSKRTKLPTGVVLTRLSARSLVINMCSDLRN